MKIEINISGDPPDSISTIVKSGTRTYIDQTSVIAATIFASKKAIDKEVLNIIQTHLKKIIHKMELEDSKVFECPQCGETIPEDLKGPDGEVCEFCYKENHTYFEAIDDLQRIGHTSHCAKRMVYGDGECECKLKERKIKGEI